MEKKNSAHSALMRLLLWTAGVQFHRETVEHMSEMYYSRVKMGVYLPALVSQGDGCSLSTKSLNRVTIILW